MALRWSMLGVVVTAVAPLASAQTQQCQEDFFSCREDCSLEHSSLKPNAPAKLEKCVRKCQKTLDTCVSREVESEMNSLEPGSPGASAKDSDVRRKNAEEVLPYREEPKEAPDKTKTSSSSSKKDEAPVRKPEVDSKRRADSKGVAEKKSAPVASDSPRAEKKEAPRKEEDEEAAPPKPSRKKVESETEDHDDLRNR